VTERFRQHTYTIMEKSLLGFRRRYRAECLQCDWKGRWKRMAILSRGEADVHNDMERHDFYTKARAAQQ
jgi:hypothetical protein